MECGQRRLQPDRRLQARDRFVMIATRPTQRGAEIAMRLGKPRVQRDGSPEARDRLLKPALLHVDLANVTVEVCQGRIDTDGPAEQLKGDIRLAGAIGDNSDQM